MMWLNLTIKIILASHCAMAKSLLELRLSTALTLVEGVCLEGSASLHVTESSTRIRFVNGR